MGLPTAPNKAAGLPTARALCGALTWFPSIFEEIGPIFPLYDAESKFSAVPQINLDDEAKFSAVTQINLDAESKFITVPQVNLPCSTCTKPFCLLVDHRDTASGKLSFL